MLKNVKASDVRNGVEYTDKLCIFRCLVLHRKDASMERKVKEYYSQWHSHMAQIGVNIPKDSKSFKGVEIGDIGHFEQCFETTISIYELQENRSAIARYSSLGTYPTHIKMNMYNHHLSYITKFEGYAKKFQ